MTAQDIVTGIQSYLDGCTQEEADKLHRALVAASWAACLRSGGRKATDPEIARSMAGAHMALEE